MPNCKSCQKDFTIYLEDKVFYNKIGVPEPESCVDCRRQQLLAFWSFGQYYKRKCDLTGEIIISTFPEKAPFPVYKKSNWLRDDWTPPELEIDLKKSFFEQFKSLQAITPHYHLLEDGTNINCDYCDDIYTSKNCYLSAAIISAEDLYFCYRTFFSRDSFDCVYCYSIENCYNCVRCWRCFNVFFSYESYDCLDCRFVYDCRNCKNCFLSSNLRNAEYYIKNKKYTKEEYEKEIKKYNLGSWQELVELKEEYAQLKKDSIHRVNLNYKNIDCSGNYIAECKNCHTFFYAEKSEDSSYLFRNTTSKDCLDCCGIFDSQLCYGGSCVVACYNVHFMSDVVRCRDSEYLDQCEDCNNCFGCVGLRKKNFCILNKQYSEEEYSSLLKKVKEQMTKSGEYGSFLPYSMMRNGYNETLAFFHYPEAKENILQKGGLWQDEMEGDVKADLSSLDLSDDITDIKKEDLLKKSVQCPLTKKVFRYIPQEINFYQKNNIALPRYHFNYRIWENYSQLLPPKEREASCYKCNRNIVTYYPAEWGYNKIYCGECYQKEIY